MPKVDLETAPERIGNASYPEPFRTRCGDVRRRALGRAGGLTTLGINLTTLAPGELSSLRHWHEREDEFVYALAGSGLLIDGTGEHPLRPGDAAGFPAGVANAHHLANRSDAPFVFLEIGPRHPEERAHYPDDDLSLVRTGGESRFAGAPEAPVAGRAPDRPALVEPATAPVTVGSDYPGAHAAPFAERRRIRLGDAAGLTQFGVSLTALPPGGLSSLRHWHEVEDEAVWVLDGRLSLIDEAGETGLGPGDAAAFPAGEANGHHFANRTERPATYLEIGTRPAADRCHYADVDLICHDAEGRTWFTRRDGTPIPDTEA